MEHEGLAALFEMGELFPDMLEPIVGSPDLFDMGNPAPDDKMVDFAAASEQAAEQAEKPKRCRRPKAEKAEQAGPEEQKPDKPCKGRAAKKEQEAPVQDKPKRVKAEKVPKDKAATTGATPAPRDATRAGEEKVVYIDLTELLPFKDHLFGVRNDTEMQSLVESVKTGGVNQLALVLPREGGGYEIIAGHRRQMASELSGFANMPCIVRNMTDDNLRHREKIPPTEKANSLKIQV